MTRTSARNLSRITGLIALAALCGTSSVMSMGAQLIIVGAGFAFALAAAHFSAVARKAVD